MYGRQVIALCEGEGSLVSWSWLCMDHNGCLSASEFISGWDQAYDHPYCLIANMLLGTF